MQLRDYIINFDFRYPDWSCLPAGFPHCDTRGLTRGERRLFEAIKIAWIFWKPGTIDTLTRYTYVNKLTYMMIEFNFLKAGYTAMYSSIIIFVIISAAYYINVEYSLGVEFLMEMFA